MSPSPGEPGVTSKLTSTAAATRSRAGLRSDLAGSRHTNPSAAAGGRPCRAATTQARRPRAAGGSAAAAVPMSPAGTSCGGPQAVLPVTPGAGTAAALSQQERDATASICQQRPPTLHSRAGCGAPGRGALSTLLQGCPSTIPSSPAWAARAAARAAGEQGTSLPRAEPPDHSSGWTGRDGGSGYQEDVS